VFFFKSSCMKNETQKLFSNSENRSKQKTNEILIFYRTNLEIREKYPVRTQPNT